jgi:hypothetical protein
MTKGYIEFPAIFFPQEPQVGDLWLIKSLGRYNLRLLILEKETKQWKDVTYMILKLLNEDGGIYRMEWAPHEIPYYENAHRRYNQSWTLLFREGKWINDHGLVFPCEEEASEDDE